MTPSFTLGWKPPTALVRADRGVELDAVTAVDLHLALIVRPGDAELRAPARRGARARPPSHIPGALNSRLEAFEDLAVGLQELRLVAIALLDLRVHALDVLISEHIFPLRDSWIINTAVSFYVLDCETHKILLKFGWRRLERYRIVCGRRGESVVRNINSLISHRRKTMLRGFSSLHAATQSTWLLVLLWAVPSPPWSIRS